MTRSSMGRWVGRRQLPRTLSRAAGRPRMKTMRFESLENRSLLTTFSVLNTDAAGPGSLSQAILDANATVGTDIIRFDLPGAGVHTIALGGVLPAVTDPVTIDGTTQAGYAGVPLVELSGGGLNLASHDSKVFGLTINRTQGYGIVMSGSGRNTVQANYIGTTADGAQPAGNRLGGILITNGSSNNIIGVDGNGLGDATEGNLISGNGMLNHRVMLGGVIIEGSHNNVVAGNTIGLDATGTYAIANKFHGVVVYQGSQGNRIGTNGNGVSDSLEANTISGNIIGVTVADYGTARTVIAGNNIGTDAAGNAAVGNGTGIHLRIGSDRTRVGTDGNARFDAAERNVISGNSGDGILMESDLNTVAGNYIGTNAAGNAAVGNGAAISDTGYANKIGAAKLAARNLISGNYAGIQLSGVSTVVQGNYIGTDISGTVGLGNGTYGIDGTGGGSFQIGGRSAAARNVISGNAWGGINLSYAGGVTTIEGNYIGTNAAGNAVVPNGTPDYNQDGFGISVWESQVTIGGTSSTARNVISGNATGGIALNNFSVSGGVVSANYIGTNALGTAALGNTGPGISVMANDVLIGGLTAAERNVISGNTVGVVTSALGTQILGNYIGTNKAGTGALGNSAEGVLLQLGASGATVGSIGAGKNVIAFNGAAGVALVDATTLGNSIRGNSIFSNGGLGIDLGNDGVTLNQPGPGPNDLLSYPVLAFAKAGSVTRIVGTYAGTPGAVIDLDFYSSPTADPSGHGEGKKYLGSLQITTDANGLATFDVTLLARSLVGETISATATDATGNTSEFALNVTATR